MSLASSTSSISSKEATPMELSPPHPTSSTSYTTPDENLQLSVKRRRTKRQRASLPPLVVSSSSMIPSEKEDDEEDMAKCLILLSVGHVGGRVTDDHKMHPLTASPYLYECKTCNKSFPTFQALGGHRASHKKPKNVVSMPAIETIREDKKMVTEEDDFRSTDGQFQHIKSISTNTLINSLGNLSKSRVHECSICRSVFSSGQALGGHMRRHRSTTATIEEEGKKEMKTTLLSFDLNLPAPLEDDHSDFSMPSFPFSATQLFASSSLVDCHY